MASGEQRQGAPVILEAWTSFGRSPADAALVPVASKYQVVPGTAPPAREIFVPVRIRFMLRP